MPDFSYHFSLDDVFYPLIGSKQSAKFWKLFLDLRRKYGIRMSLNTFNSSTGLGMSLADIPVLSSEKMVDKTGERWVYFGPHSKNAETKPFEQHPNDLEHDLRYFYDNFDRITGKESRSYFVRLHYYSEMYELGSLYSEKGVKALFSTDRIAGSHRMGKQVADLLLKTGEAIFEGVKFIRTDFRVEDLANQNLSKQEVEVKIAGLLSKDKRVVFYVHEYELDRPEVVDMLYTCFDTMKALNVSPVPHP